MKGKLEIIAHNSIQLTIKGDIGEPSETDKVIIFDCLANALELTEEERQLIGVIIYGGGVVALGGPQAQIVKFDNEMLGMLRKIKEKQNETDAL